MSSGWKGMVDFVFELTWAKVWAELQKVGVEQGSAEVKVRQIDSRVSFCCYSCYCCYFPKKLIPGKKNILYLHQSGHWSVMFQSIVYNSVMLRKIVNLWWNVYISSATKSYHRVSYACNDFKS